MNQMTGENAVPARATRREWIGLAVLTLAALVYAMDLTVLNLADPADQRGAAANERAAAVDHRHLRLPRRRPAHHDGHARRSHRPAQAPARRRRGLRAGVAARGVLDELGDAHRQPRGHGHRRRDDRPLDPVADLHDVPGPEAALHRDRLLDRRLLRRRRHRTGPRRRAPRVLLVGIGVPDRRPGDGAAAHPRPAHAARVPGPERAAAGPAQRRDVAARHPRRRLRAEGDRAGWDRADAGRSRSSPASLVGIVFVRRQLHLESPIIDVRLFRIRAFSASLGTYFLGIFVVVGYFLFIAQYLQLVLGLSPLEAAVWSLPSAVGFIVGSIDRAEDHPSLPPVGDHGRGHGDRGGGDGDAPRLGLDGDGSLLLIVVASIVISLGLAPGHHARDRAHRGQRPAGAGRRRDRDLRDERRARRRAGDRDPRQPRHGRLPAEVADSLPSGGPGGGRGCGAGHARRRDGDRRDAAEALGGGARRGGAGRLRRRDPRRRRGGRRSARSRRRSSPRSPSGACPLGRTSRIPRGRRSRWAPRSEGGSRRSRSRQTCSCPATPTRSATSRSGCASWSTRPFPMRWNASEPDGG